VYLEKLNTIHRKTLNSMAQLNSVWKW